MTSRRFLVTGGAGFIGSHLVADLSTRGHRCTVFDNLSTGHRAAVCPAAAFIHGDLADAAAIDAVVADGPWDAVFHLADLSLVGASMAAPIHYLTTNFGNGARLVESCVRHGVGRLVFSSTANLFGAAGAGLIDEQAPVAPGSPYGEAKHMVERLLGWASEVHGLRSACLRFFNAAGCDPLGLLGEDHTPETHLIPRAIDAALGRKPALVVLGEDWPTPDGTGIRDYIHVNDLVSAHLHALERLEQGSVAFNVGLGIGVSVREVIASVARIAGRPVPHRFEARRPGDPAILVANPAKIMRETGWRPVVTGIDSIVETAFAWRLAHPHGFGETAA